MRCPYCSSEETKVNDSREGKDGTFIKRRRECLRCEKRFTTIEKVQKLDLEVVKSNGAIEEFSLAKIKKSLMKACEKRPVTLEQIEKTTDNILEDLKKFDGPSIPTSAVGQIVLKNLKKLDEIAFLKYAIVHNDYESMSEFIDKIEELKKFGNRVGKNKKLVLEN